MAAFACLVRQECGSFKTFGSELSVAETALRVFRNNRAVGEGVEAEAMVALLGHGDAFPVCLLHGDEALQRTGGLCGDYAYGKCDEE